MGEMDEATEKWGTTTMVEIHLYKKIIQYQKAPHTTLPPSLPGASAALPPWHPLQLLPLLPPSLPCPERCWARPP